jgi:hypothetical protein
MPLIGSVDGSVSWDLPLSAVSDQLISRCIGQFHKRSRWITPEGSHFNVLKDCNRTTGSFIGLIVRLHTVSSEWIWGADA